MLVFTGAQIILSMKLIGLAFDISSEKTDLPGGATYLGYVFCVGTVIFGPWTSYHDYLHAVHQNRIKSFVSWDFMHTFENNTKLNVMVDKITNYNNHFTGIFIM